MIKFFEKIINFVRDTTWLQPFMVSALMFFSIAMIPIISGGIRNFFLMPNDTDIFYRRYKKNAKEADKLFQNFIDYKKDKNIKIPDKEFKYFLLFLDKKNTIASEYAKSFYEILGSKGKDGKKIILYTIYIDENYDSFKKILNNNKMFFYEILRSAKKNNDFVNGIINEETANRIINSDNFVSPLLLLIDFSDKNDPINVYFDIKGDDDFEKINFLYNCWNNN